MNKSKYLGKPLKALQSECRSRQPQGELHSFYVNEQVESVSGIWGGLESNGCCSPSSSPNPLQLVEWEVLHHTPEWLRLARSIWSNPMLVASTQPKQGHPEQGAQEPIQNSFNLQQTQTAHRSLPSTRPQQPFLVMVRLNSNHNGIPQRKTNAQRQLSRSFVFFFFFFNYSFIFKLHKQCELVQYLRK